MKAQLLVRNMNSRAWIGEGQRQKVDCHGLVTGVIIRVWVDHVTIRPGFTFWISAQRRFPMLTLCDLVQRLLSWFYPWLSACTVPCFLSERTKLAFYLRLFSYQPSWNLQLERNIKRNPAQSQRIKHERSAWFTSTIQRWRAPVRRDRTRDIGQCSSDLRLNFGSAVICRVQTLTYSPYHRKPGKKVFSLDLHQDWHQASRTIIIEFIPFWHVSFWWYPCVTFAPCLPAVIGSRLFGFKRNTTLFCGVRKHVSELDANRSSDIILSPFTVTGILSGYLFTQVSKRVYLSTTVTSGPTFWNGLSRNVSHHVLPFNIGLSRDCYCTGGCRGSTLAFPTPEQTRISSIRKNSSVNPFPP